MTHISAIQRKIATAIYSELSKDNKVQIDNASDLKDTSLSDFDLIVIGSPTRAFAPTPKIKSFIKGISKQYSSLCSFWNI